MERAVGRGGDGASEVSGARECRALRARTGTLSFHSDLGARNRAEICLPPAAMPRIDCRGRHGGWEAVSRLFQSPGREDSALSKEVALEGGRWATVSELPRQNGQTLLESMWARGFWPEQGRTVLPFASVGRAAKAEV